MTAALQSLRICGNILSTDSFSYFALRCAACEANFGQWPAFIRHLQRWHSKKTEENENNQVDDSLITASELEWKAEELKIEDYEEALIDPIEYLEEDDNLVKDKKDEIDFLRSEDERTATDDADEDWKPVKVKREFKVTGQEEVFLSETEWAEDEAGNQRKKKSQTKEVDSSGELAKSSKKHKTFYFNLTNPEYKQVSLEFLQLLEGRPCLWSTTVKSRYGTKSQRILARKEIKLRLRDLGYSVSDKTIASTTSRILQEHKDAELEASQNDDLLDARSRLLLENCKFLNCKEEDAVDKLKQIEKRRSNAAKEEKEQKNTKYKKPKRGSKSLEESCSDDDDEEIKGEDRVDNLAENSDNDSVISEYSDESNGSSKSMNGTDIVTSKLKKNNLPYKRIRFQLAGNKIASDFINLLREQPAVWDGTHPDYRNKEKRRHGIESWIPHFKEKHNITFNYDDLNENWQILRVYYMNQVGRKRISPASIALRERLSFLSTRKTKQRVKCEHCERFVMGERNYENHLYLKHGIGECPFKCADCGGKEFRGAAELNMHIKQTHSDAADYHCSFCERKFTQRNNMLIHEQQHTGVMNFVCSHCGQSFRRKANLIAHEVRIHLRQRNFACSMCPKAFYTKGLLKDHINAHLNIRNHKCPTCDKGFHSAHALMRHKQIHTEIKRYACKLCDARFHQFVGLNAHMKNRHQFVNQQQHDDADMEPSYLIQTAAATNPQVVVAAQQKIVGAMRYGY